MYGARSGWIFHRFDHGRRGVMAVVSLSSFRTEPGRLADHLGAAAEALGHLRRIGMQAVNLQAIAGTDVGTIATSINYANNAAYVAGLQQILGDEQWQEFWARAAAGASAVQVEGSLFSDVDATFQPSADRPLGVIMATQWRAKPGRLMDFMGNVMTSFPHIARMGGMARAMQSVIGAHPMTVLVTTSFADLDAYGAYADTIAGDEQWQAFWAGAMADPTADLIRSGLYVNISG
jgi:hypothetical protein